MENILIYGLIDVNALFSQTETGKVKFYTYDNQINTRKWESSQTRRHSCSKANAQVRHEFLTGIRILVIKCPLARSINRLRWSIFLPVFVVRSTKAWDHSRLREVLRKQKEVKARSLFVQNIFALWAEYLESDWLASSDYFVWGRYEVLGGLVIAYLHRFGDKNLYGIDNTKTFPIRSKTARNDLVL